MPSQAPTPAPIINLVPEAIREVEPTLGPNPAVLGNAPPVPEPSYPMMTHACVGIFKPRCPINITSTTLLSNLVVTLSPKVLNMLLSLLTGFLLCKKR